MTTNPQHLHVQILIGVRNFVLELRRMTNSCNLCWTCLHSNSDGNNNDPFGYDTFFCALLRWQAPPIDTGLLCCTIYIVLVESRCNHEVVKLWRTKDSDSKVSLFSSEMGNSAANDRTTSVANFQSRSLG